MIQLSTPFPPTTNNLFLNANKGRVPTPAYKAWKKAAWDQVQLEMCFSAQGDPILGPYRMTIRLERPDNRSRDLSNYIKALEDLLVSCGVIRDDSDARSLYVEWTDRKPGKGAQAHITIKPLEGEKPCNQ